MKRITILTGAVASVLLIAPLTAIFYLAYRVIETPFPAFDLFDQVSRVLPGRIITFGIDTMVDFITAIDIGRTDTVAKTAEQLLGTAQFVGLGIIVGIIYFVIVRNRVTTPETIERDSLISGAIFGFIVSIPVIILSADINTNAATSTLVSSIWMAAAFIVWGIGLGYVYNRLFDLGNATQSDEEEQLATVSVINRRQFLMQVGAATATVTVVSAGIGLLSEPSSDSDVLGASLNAEFDPVTALNLPNADDPVAAAPGTRPEYTPIENHYRIDISSGRPPRIEAESYILPITGLINNPVELTLDQIQNDYEPMHQYITMSCISNRLGGDLISTTRWTGVSMQRILELIDPKPEATHIKITAADGFDEYVALDLIREDETIMLTYAWDGAPLRQRHGFPLRIHIPNRFGMKQPKWITEMEFVDEWQEGYWVRRGWSRDAIAVTTSVIDTIAADMMIIDAENSAMHIPIGGIAWAGARSIEKVEIRIDGGEWVEAELRSPLSQKTWMVWRYEWLFEAGRHEFEVRCVDGNGDPQIESSRGTRPDGATGIHDVTVNL